MELLDITDAKVNLGSTMTSSFLPSLAFAFLVLACSNDPKSAPESSQGSAGDPEGQAAAPFEQDFFTKGDRIAFLGGGLADRMQHDGWTEAYLQAGLATFGEALELSFRNHGYTGDRIDHRPRNKGFLSADEYLSLSKASVVFAIFGYNESFDEEPEALQAAIADWVTHTRSQDYSGKGAPKIVLFSPIAAQDLRDPNLADAAELEPALRSSRCGNEKGRGGL